jgi:Zn-dependent M28 family amino/carboxypeptidase
LTGSTAFIKSIDRTKEKVVLAINLDMIANGSDSEDIDLFTRPEYTWLADDIRGLADAYGLNAKKNIRGGCD